MYISFDQPVRRFRKLWPIRRVSPGVAFNHPFATRTAAGSVGALILAQTVRRCVLSNLFDRLPLNSENEEFIQLVSRPGARIERIVSHSHFTASGEPYDQDHDEWVLLLRGSASLWVDGDGEHDLRPGDYVMIRAHQLHRVTRTAESEPTVWLAVHFC
jgi:cupin 2 domain-containing protein